MPIASQGALLLALCLLLPASSAQEAAPASHSAGVASSYWSDSWRGWHFYEDPERPDDPVVPRDRRPPPASTVPTRPRAPELIQFEQLQKTLEEYRNIAIMRPTEANVRRYMELEARVVGQASYFADVAQRVAWATPELDPTLRGRPVNAKAIEVFEQDQLAKRSQTMAELGKDHVLFFFFRSDCPYCHALAPILDAFQLRHGIRVMAISMDGGTIPGFPDARTDNGISRTLKVAQVPALFLAQPYTGKITPIGFGVLSEAQLLERISIVTKSASDEALPNLDQQIILR
ncbi:MAG: conjugal transfer protein TraF [Pseudomonadota bacterium]